MSNRLRRVKLLREVKRPHVQVYVQGGVHRPILQQHGRSREEKSHNLPGLFPDSDESPYITTEMTETGENSTETSTTTQPTTKTRQQRQL